MPMPMRPLRQLRTASAPTPTTKLGNYGVAQHETGVTNPAGMPEFESVVGASATTRGTQGQAAWLGKHFGKPGMPLSLSRMFHRTDIDFGG